MKTDFLIVAGEASGDSHAAELIQSLKKLNPAITFTGIGGKKMQALGVNLIADAKDMAVVGLFEIISHAKIIFNAYYKMKKLIQSKKFSSIILVDYPGFNLRLAQIAKKAGLRVIYYISPQLWAWKAKRIEIIKKYVDQMLVILPFEENYYRDRGVPAIFVGHPLSHSVKKTVAREETLKSLSIEENQRPVICLLPGSRQSEIKRLFPEMIHAAKQLKEIYPDSVFILPLASTLTEADFAPFINADLAIKWVKENHYNILAASDACIAASGTVTLELALLEIPHVIIYRMNPLSFWLAKKIIKVKYIGLANIIAEQYCAKELIQNDANADNIATEIKALIENKSYRQMYQLRMQAIKSKLSDKPEDFAARVILGL